jgi:hypothetical protein
MVRIAIHDEHVFKLALVRLPLGVTEQLRGVEFFDRNAPAAISYEVHGVFPLT